MGIWGTFLYLCQMHFPGGPAQLQPGQGSPRLPGPRGPGPRALPQAAPTRSGPGLCPAGSGPRAALTSAGLRSPRACAEPDKWYAMTRGMITLLLLVIIRVNAI